MLEEIKDEAINLSEKLIQQLAFYGSKVREKYDYYDNSQTTSNVGIALSNNMRRKIKPGVGWAARSVTSITSRLNFEGFSNDRLSINKLLEKAGGISAFNQSKIDALIAGCSFIVISEINGEYKLIPFNALEATGVVNQNTGELECGLAVTEWLYGDQIPKIYSDYQVWPKTYYLFTKKYTASFINGELVEVVNNPINKPLIFQITYRQSIHNPLGQSRISRASRRIIDEVVRLKQRYDIAAEFYSAPRDYINGLMTGEGEEKPSIETALGKIMTIEKDEDGEKPEIGRLPQMSMSQFEDQKKGLARDFCAETSLPLRALGYDTSNPTSAEALSAMMDDLLLIVKDCQREMGVEFKNIAIALEMLINNTSKLPENALSIKPEWSPYTQIDIGATGDALYKLFEIMPELKGSFESYRKLGLGIEESEKLSSIAKSVDDKNIFMVTGEVEK